MSAWRPLGPLLLAAALGLLCFGAFVWWPIVADDAYITFRYAEHLANGIGPVFNAGERVEGYSNPLWMLAMAGAIGVGLDPVFVSKILGVASGLVLLGLLHRASRSTGVPSWGAGLAAIFVGASTPLQVWSVGGLETVLYALLFFAGLERLARHEGGTRSALLASTLLAAAALTRPEGIACWGIGAAIVFLWRRSDVLYYGLPGIVLLLHLAWRFSYYGDLLPNTFYAKAGEGPVMWGAGLAELRDFLFEPAPAQALLCALASTGALVGIWLVNRTRAVAIFGGATALHVAYVLSVGGDGLGWSRFYVPILAPLAFLASLLLHRDLGAGRRRNSLRLAACIGAVGAVVQTLAVLTLAELPGLNRESQIYKEGKERLGRHLRETRPPDTLIAVTAAGAIPYYSGLPTVDMFGLSDRHIARQPFREGPWIAGHMKWDNAYVLSRRPDLIAINHGYFPAGELAGRIALQGPEAVDLRPEPMNRDLYAQIRRDGGYEFKPILFPDGARYFVFERRREAAAGSD